MPTIDRDPDMARVRERVRLFLGLPPRERPSDLATVGINRMAHPVEHGALNLADARAYHERLAARGEKDES